MAFLAIVVSGGLVSGLLSSKFFPHTRDVMIQIMASIAVVASLLLGYALYFPSMGAIGIGMLGLFFTPLSVGYLLGLSLYGAIANHPAFNSRHTA